MTPPDRDVLLKQYKDEKRSHRYLATLYKVSTPTIVKWIDDYNIPRNKQSIDLHHLNDHLEKSHLEDGLTLKEIAKQIGVSHSKLHTHFVNAKIKVRTTEIEKPDKQQLKDLYLKMTKKEMADHYGCTIPTITKWLHYYKIEERTKSQTHREFVRPRFVTTVKQRYGVSHPFLLDEVKQKSRKTKIEKYGTPYPNHKAFASKPERDIRDLFANHGIEFIKNYSLVPGFQLDLFSEQLKLAIEYCGLYWHNNASPSPKGHRYHWHKYNECQKQGITLITLFEDEWRDRRTQVEGFLLSKVASTKIHGRNTTIQLISNDAAKHFCQLYHVQGAPRNVKFSFGCFSGQRLIGVMTISSHHRNKDLGLVLSRLCWERGTTVVGGLSKLVAAYKKHTSAPLITWSDNRLTNGLVYAKAGFVLDTEYPPDYSYVNMKRPTKRIPKQQFQRKLIGARDNQTESERAKELGFAKVWDCGKKKWVLK